MKPKEKQRRSTPEFRAKRSAYRRAQYAKDPDKFKTANYRWRLNNPEKWKAMKSATYQRNKEKIKAKAKDWYIKNKAHCVLLSKYRTLLYNFGLTRDDYHAMLMHHGNRCAICKLEFRSTRDTHTDHCHVTGRVRGLLCTKCNMRLGCFERQKQWLKKAFSYLRTTSSPRFKSWNSRKAVKPSPRTTAIPMHYEL